MTTWAPAQAVGLEVEAAMVLDDVAAHPWDSHSDLVIVGLGGAGVAAALEGVEAGLRVLAVDRYEGGGSTAANGGVFYAGGGTRIQQQAGEVDSPEDMYNYLKLEAGQVVAEATLRDFVARSAPTVDWIMQHGGQFDGSKVWKQKASYPPLDHFLYHPDNSLVASYRAQAKPAARGHRAFATNGKKAWGLGAAIVTPLREAALRQGLVFQPLTEARQLVLDRSGRVVGLKVLQLPEGSAAAAQFRRYIRRAATLLAMLPPSLPMASVTIGLGNYYMRKAARIEAQHRITRWIRAEHGVLLSAGGFIMNPRMVAHYAPTYAKSMPNGTLGDQGAGILLGMSAGGATGLMDKISAWRFINPPKAWSDGMVVNRQGARFVDETVYGATLGEHIGDRQGGKAWLVYDAALRQQAFAQAKDPKLVPFQRDVTRLNLAFNYTQAPTLEALAHKLQWDPAVFTATVAAYNRAALGQAQDVWGKQPADMQPLSTPPYYAMDISVDSKFLPMSTITSGGLRVEETSGQVLHTNGQPIAGLYAAGRTAIGIASQTYVSGLSFADCIYSGRRAARHVAQQVHGGDTAPTAASTRATSPGMTAPLSAA